MIWANVIKFRQNFIASPNFFGLVRLWIIIFKNYWENTLNCNCEDIWIQISDFNSNQIFYLGVIYQDPKSIEVSFRL